MEAADAAAVGLEGGCDGVEVFDVKYFDIPEATEETFGL
jgi:hypothetical protein